MELFVFIIGCIVVLVPGLRFETLEPSFDVAIVNVTAVAGDPVILPCSVKNLDSHAVVWQDYRDKVLTLRDRRIISDERISLERPGTDDWNLYIRGVSTEDAGRYTCHINTNPVKVKYVVLYVNEAPKIINEMPNYEIISREGQKVTIECNATGIPQPEVTWYRRQSTHDGKSKRLVGSKGEILIIHNITRYCDDIYECVANNNIPPAASREVQVTVQFPPEVYLPNKRMGQYKGKETILECKVTANPNMNSVWLRNGKELENNRSKYRTEVYQDGRYTVTLALKIRDVNENDFGQYKCVASNTLGDDSETMYLHEYFNPTPAPTTPRHMLPPIEKPPAEGSGPSIVVKSKDNPVNINNGALGYYTGSSIITGRYRHQGQEFSSSGRSRVLIYVLFSCLLLSLSLFC